MLHSWTRNIVLISALMLIVASCKKPEYSKDEPLTPEETSGVYIGSKNNFLYAFNPTTGQKLWEQNVGFEVVHEPLVLDGLLFLTSPIGVLKIDGSTGVIVDTTFDLQFAGDTTRHYVLGPLSGKGETIYGATNTGFIAAFNYKSRQVIWQTQLPEPETSPVLYNNLLIFTAGNTIYAIDQNQGDQVGWTYTAGAVLTNPTVSAPFVYVCDITGKLYQIDAEDGTATVIYDAMSATATSAIAAGGNILFGSDDNYLHCIDLAQNVVRWKFVTDERIRSSPYFANNVVYFGSYDHHLYAVNIADGSLKWRYRTGALIKSSPLAYGSTVYVGGYDKIFYAFDTTGQLKWKFNVNGLIDASPVLYDADASRVEYPAVSGMSSQ